MKNFKKKGPNAVLRWRNTRRPKVSQMTLGRAVGVDGSMIHQYEQCKKDLTLPRKVAIAAFTGIPLTEWPSRVNEGKETVRAIELFELFISTSIK